MHLLLVFGILMVLILIAGIAGKTEEPLTSEWALLMSIVAVGSIGSSVWLWRVGPKLPKIIEELSRILKIEGDRLVVSKPLQVKQGVLNLVYRAGDKTPVNTYFAEESKETKYVKEVDPDNFAGSANILANVPWRMERVNFAEVEWIKIPGYEITDPRFKVGGRSVVIAVITPQRIGIVPLRGRLEVSRNSEIGIAELSATNDGLKGAITYIKPPNGRTKELRLELVFSRRVLHFGAIYRRIVVARLKESGTIKFFWNPSVNETFYILLVNRLMDPRVLIRQYLGIQKP